MVFDSSRTRLSQWEELYLDLEVKGKSCTVSSAKLPAFDLDCHEHYETVDDFIDLFCEAMDEQVESLHEYRREADLQQREIERLRARLRKAEREAEAMIVDHTRGEIAFYSDVEKLRQVLGRTPTFEGVPGDARFWYRRGYEINQLATAAAKMERGEGEGSPRGAGPRWRL